MINKKYFEKVMDNGHVQICLIRYLCEYVKLWCSLNQYELHFYKCFDVAKLSYHYNDSFKCNLSIPDRYDLIK